MLPAKGLNRFRNASGSLPVLAVLGPAELIVDGESARLSPRALEVLLRLAVDAGEPVPVDRIYRDVWESDDSGVRQAQRNQVQKAINEVRRVVGAKASIIETDQRGRTSSYRLLLDDRRLDLLRFQNMVEQARRSDLATAAESLEAALSLWRGAPLPEIAHLPFATPVIRRMRGLRAAAERDLLTAYQDLGRHRDALDLAVRLSAGDPDDTGLADTVAELHGRLRNGRRDLLRREIDGSPPFVVSLVVGDIFAEHDAHLVVGFTDTFDTDTRADLVINGASLQAETTRRLFGGDRGRLDRRLRAALSRVDPVGREARADKRHGKLIRYPVGTVAVVRAGGRQVYALAYSRMGNDLVARSSRQDLTLSLDRLWAAVYLSGQLRPVAMPLVGAGLSRIPAAGADDLLRMVISSFVAANRRTRMSTELRIVLRPGDLARIDARTIADHLAELGASSW